MHRRISALLAVIMAVFLFNGYADAAGTPTTSAASAILMDADSGRVLYEQNADAKMLIASTTKIMTALVALRESDLNSIVTVSRNAAYTEGSSMYLSEGETLTLETLLYGLLLCSGNDAAVAIAEHVAGSVEDFAELMNAAAREFGMTRSSFANPSGLDHEEHYSTARDMAVLACHAMDNTTLMRIASTRTAVIGGRTMTNHNKLLRCVDGCLGLKTGYTKAAGRTLVSCAERNGQRLVAVTLQDGNDWADHQALLDYGFAVWSSCTAAVTGQPFAAAAVSGGLRPMVTLAAAERFSWPLTEGETLESRTELDQPLTAPIQAGTIVGAAAFTLNGEEIGRVPLICAETVLSRPVTAMSVLREKFTPSA